MKMNLVVVYCLAHNGVCLGESLRKSFACLFVFLI